MIKQKSFEITKQQVFAAYKKVKSNKGSAGVDNESLVDFEMNFKNNLYKIWNRMSSGSYFPPAVLEVKIPKKDGKLRKLGIPTVGDRIAQMVVSDYLKPRLEVLFHPDSYGYRNEKSAHDALAKARRLCWEYDWVIDLDIQGFFDNLDHHLLMRAVRYHTRERWVQLYIERWLEAPVQTAEGEVISREKGTPQGGVISPLLANLFLHHAFDRWMSKELPELEFERYADDIIVHCKTLLQAEYVLSKIKVRLNECKLQLHPEKTKIVYCKDSTRRGSYQNVQFTFLGYTFRARRFRSSEGRTSNSFTPAVSKDSLKRMYCKLRELEIHRRTLTDIQEIAQLLNPLLRGWINYYGLFRKSALNYFLHRVNLRLLKWAGWKYKKLRNRKKRAIRWLQQVYDSDPNLFAHWSLGIKPKALMAEAV